ncbi:hypothetical protein CNMCM6106_001453 [Aspergillus hiratsukae]|uniref:Uncharacterized protein n=1 Tax=Aspergillus hiratsukae TaxID=1194566 RepID=A0A8H6Q1B9_9EURO|nr:hypothetical protein CNMCM6106_001453 [Aspergillus hiratsukae]
MKASALILSALVALCVNPALARVPGRPSPPVSSSHTSGYQAFGDAVFESLHPISHTIHQSVHQSVYESVYESVHDSMPVERPEAHRSLSLALFHFQPSSKRKLHTEWKAFAPWRSRWWPWVYFFVAADEQIPLKSQKNLQLPSSHSTSLGRLYRDFDFPCAGFVRNVLRRVMKKCLGPARLPCLGRRFSSFLSPSASYGRSFSSLRRPSLLSRGIYTGRGQWSRPFSARSAAVVDRQLLRDYVQFERKRCPVSGPKSRQEDPGSWIPLLERYLPPSLRKVPEEATVTDAEFDAATTMGRETLAQTIELANLLFYARTEGNIDLLAYLGFRLNNWPAVNVLLTRLLDAADTLDKYSIPRRPLSSHDWGSGANVSLDELTDQHAERASELVHLTKSPAVSELTSFDSWTERPFADEHAKRFMAEVWKSLGSIVLDAADASPNESKLAMSYVFRILARLHHSGAVSDRVYKYDPPSVHRVNFRPPGMHLLSTHIMSVLTDAAWLAHEAEVAAKAAAAGKKSPYVPLNLGIRELGHEIWLELILWSCVEHGYIQEGVWLIERMRSRTDSRAWNFESWKHLIESSRSVWKTNVDAEVSWRRPEDIDRQWPSRRHNGLAPFNGLGERTISAEVAAALLDSLPNLVYLGLGWRGLSPSALLRHVSSLRPAIASPTADAKLLPTAKATNWFVIRAIESGGFNAEIDPRAFEALLKVTPHVIPPWSNNTSPMEENVESLTRGQLYDDTSAFAGLMEYNIRFFASRRLCTDALDAFSWLQEVVDASKLQRIREFSERVGQSDTAGLPSFDLDSLESFKPFESSMPQMSVVTVAELLDLITTSRAFAFGNWLFFSDDIDGPPIPPSAYGNQALAPSIIRFAAATKNEALCNLVVRSLSQPLSLNTMRALLNFRIAMGQWDAATMMLEYIRDYRLKSWGYSNVTALAAAIVRMDHAIKQQPSPEQQSDLDRAKDLLLRLLNGEFNESSHDSKHSFQDRLIHSIHRVFLTIPGSLREIAQKTQLKYKATPRSNHPYIPATAFHSLLSAVVDTQGSAAGKRLWEQWCLDIRSPTFSRLQEGGITRLYLHRERDPRKGDPHFDPRFFAQMQKKAVIPNPNTIRIIAQQAVKEYTEFEVDEARRRQLPGQLEQDSNLNPSSQGAGATNPALQVVDFCIRQFQAFRVPWREINRELGGLVYHIHREKKKERKKMGREDA